MATARCGVPEASSPDGVESFVDKFIGTVWIAMMENKWGSDAPDGGQRSSNPPAWIKMRSRLCFIVARCGGLISTQPYDECPSAKELVYGMFDSQGSRFAGIVDAARDGEYSNFETRVKELLASRGESSLLPLVLKSLYVALGSGRQRWRGPVRRICGHVVQAAADDAGGRPFEENFLSPF
ncbi:hypothetical protein FOZ61_000899 [Perkinsus olseni]|uniref:Uncharacterized protein n=1 Tax=Perkinsus olseni TaxID=32597 RepID=A0A7J6KRP5_PEROL|nr:hypothetical protein FOZ61_000899 [Perkinsus olseni]